MECRVDRTEDVTVGPVALFEGISAETSTMVALFALLGTFAGHAFWRQRDTDHQRKELTGMAIGLAHADRDAALARVAHLEADLAAERARPKREGP